MENKTVGRYVLTEKWLIAVISLTGIIYNVGLAATPWFEGQLAQTLCDIVGGTKEAPAMAAVAAGYVLTVLAVQFLRFLKRLYVRKFANNINRSMKLDLYRGLLQRSFEELNREGAGKLMTKAISDVDACAEGIRKFTTEVFDTGVALLGYLALLLCYDPLLTLIVMVFPPAAFFLAERLKTAVTRAVAAAKESAGRLNGATLDRLENALTYRVSGMESTRDAAYEEKLTDYEKKTVRAGLFETAMPPVYQIIAMLGAVLILWLGGRNAAGTGWRAWDVAAFTAFLSCFTRLSVKAGKAAKLFNNVQKARVSWGRIRPWLENRENREERCVASPGRLEVRGVSFAYPGGESVFRDASFCAEPGQIIGITGEVACGKTTLGKVILGELPFDGKILFGGRNIGQITEAFAGYLGHESELFSGTVAENITLGVPGEVDGVLAAVCLDGEVDGNTRIGSGGVRLSGGQQARLALARTLYHKRPLLILDDPFASVDPKTEAKILQNLRTLAPDSVILLLTHRLAWFPELDGAVWMEDGHIVSGSHAQLMESCPGYARLFRMQTGGDGHEA